jgi:hypothetical protein
LPFHLQRRCGHDENALSVRFIVLLSTRTAWNKHLNAVVVVVVVLFWGLKNNEGCIFSHFIYSADVVVMKMPRLHLHY